MKGIMDNLRTNGIASIAGKAVNYTADYKLSVKKSAEGETVINLPKSNVLRFFAEDGSVVSVRPSGTEPKIKFYFGVKGDDVDAKLKALMEQFNK